MILDLDTSKYKFAPKAKEVKLTAPRGEKSEWKRPT